MAPNVTAGAIHAKYRKNEHAIVYNIAIVISRYKRYELIYKEKEV